MNLFATPLNAAHKRLGARMVPFAGFEMPLHYGSQLTEHQRVRESAGLFDVSHMMITDLDGDQSRAFLRYLLANDVARLEQTGQALYSCMLNTVGGVVDDLIVYRLGMDRYRLVTNAVTRSRVQDWLRQHAAGFNVALHARQDLAMLAVQGPRARAVADSVLIRVGFEERALTELTPFTATTREDWQVARTGYTGEDGYEIMLPAERIEDLWQALLDAGASPCGLAARDTLRLEAGLRLYGADMDETITPLDAGLEWSVAWEPVDRDFIGRQALEKQRLAGVTWRCVGLVLLEGGVLRSGQKVIVPGIGEGLVTSGSFSPTLQKSIALARVPPGTGATCHVEIRGQLRSVRVTPPRFVRQGRILIGAN